MLNGNPENPTRQSKRRLVLLGFTMWLTGIVLPLAFSESGHAAAPWVWLTVTVLAAPIPLLLMKPYSPDSIAFQVLALGFVPCLYGVATTVAEPGAAIFSSDFFIPSLVVFAGYIAYAAVQVRRAIPIRESNRRPSEQSYRGRRPRVLLRRVFTTLFVGMGMCIIAVIPNAGFPDDYRASWQGAEPEGAVLVILYATMLGCVSAATFLGPMLRINRARPTRTQANYRAVSFVVTAAVAAAFFVFYKNH